MMEYMLKQCNIRKIQGTKENTYIKMNLSVEHTISGNSVPSIIGGKKLLNCPCVMSEAYMQKMVQSENLVQ